MKQTSFHTLPPPPDRPELRGVPLAPRLVMEVSRLLRARMPYEAGIMAQSTARLVMSHLALNGAMGQLDLVHLTRLKPPTVSVLLRRMEEEGYVTRIQDEQDRRAVRVALTERACNLTVSACNAFPPMTTLPCRASPRRSAARWRHCCCACATISKTGR
jgi:DNA-binding MarR family transcriptional regulator